MLSQYTYAKSILDKYNFKAIFYIICNSVDKENRMNWDNIQTLEEEGHEIGSHSMNHQKLSKLSDEQMKYEIIESKRCLQKNGFDIFEKSALGTYGYRHNFISEFVYIITLH
jgi:peptidoglycan/xylan/chitin deacetylase (PgdA/CDA1 family)